MEYVTLKHSLAKDVRSIIDEELERAGDTYVVGIIAERVVSRLRMESPELLAKFLDEHAVQVISTVVGQISRLTRATVQHKARTASFRSAMERFEQGDTKALGAWHDAMYVVTVNDQRKRLGDMYKEDLEFAVSDYVNRARSNTIQASFLAALAAKVGAKKVSEVFTEEELARMWNSLQ